MVGLIAQAAVAGTREVCETMMSVCPVPSEADAIVKSGEWISAVIGLASDHLAISVVLHFPMAVARQMTARMLDISPDTVDADGSGVRDAVGEIANMVVGRIKGQICANHPGLVISLPSVVEGTAFNIWPAANAPRFAYKFELSGGAFWIEGAVREQATRLQGATTRLPRAAA
jgi:chemotaxis protein CheX